MNDNDLVTVAFNIKRGAIKHALEEVEFHSDEYNNSGPFPPSKEWEEFRASLREGYENAF